MSEAEHKRLKILLGCYACNPNYGSEPGTGWKFVTSIAKHHDIHVIAEEEVGKDDILRYQKEHPEELKNVTFHFIRRRRFRWLRKIWPPSYYWTYRCWQKKAYKLAMELDKAESFDLVHQITLVGYREPGYLWKLGKPFIWGPLGGFTQTAMCVLSGLGLYNKLYFGMRNLMNAWQMRFSYAARKVAPRAHTIFVSDPQVKEKIHHLWHREPLILREVGTNNAALPEDKLSTHTPGTPLRICWSGNLIPLKALDFLIVALARCNQPMILEVIGRGNKLKDWENLAEKHGVRDKINFHGYIDHNEVGNLMASCHVFCMTSIKEGGTPTVILEALESGLPIIALNHCAFASVVNESCGYKVDLQNRNQIIDDIAHYLDKLAIDESLRKQLAIGSLKRSHDFTWESKLEILNKVYSSATTH